MSKPLHKAVELLAKLRDKLAVLKVSVPVEAREDVADVAKFAAEGYQEVRKLMMGEFEK